MKKEDWYKVYSKAHNNAVDLLSDAELLDQMNKFARAYFLAFTGLEEIAKSQLAADVYTGFLSEQEFWDCFKSHKKKINRLAWASEDARHYLDSNTEEYVEVSHPQEITRMNSLYVDISSGKVITPNERVTSKDSSSIIHTLRVAIDRISDVEQRQGRIGTKGFMK
ncbi:MAG: AbiV family abortive infection protein [Acidobacteria bacterium]|nr:AbiV family abortive infection protein [Acidobacteriota bacterium]